MQKPHTHKLVNKQFYVQFDYKQFYVPLDSPCSICIVPIPCSIVQLPIQSWDWVRIADGILVRTLLFYEQVSTRENMRQRRSFSFPSSHYCTNFSLYLKKSFFHAGAFVSDGILAASSRVALAKVDLRSRELINRSVLPHKHLDGPSCFS